MEVRHTAATGRNSGSTCKIGGIQMPTHVFSDEPAPRGEMAQGFMLSRTVLEVLHSKHLEGEASCFTNMKYRVENWTGCSRAAEHLPVHLRLPANSWGVKHHCRSKNRHQGKFHAKGRQPCERPPSPVQETRIPASLNLHLNSECQSNIHNTKP